MSYEISGTVVCMTGAPVENATVAINNKFSLTNENGVFSIKNIPEGNYTLKVVHRRYFTLQQAVHVTSDLHGTVIYLKLIPPKS